MDNVDNVDAHFKSLAYNIRRRRDINCDIKAIYLKMIVHNIHKTPKPLFYLTSYPQFVDNLPPKTLSTL